ncbi:hypothetical protein BJ165DRAFT_1405764 [Panaeolus papilionaceus]|nr:hypothetical protein BJ165DRAFT_1405764 [Panaeolus papilionaceus]
MTDQQANDDVWSIPRITRIKPATLVRFYLSMYDEDTTKTVRIPIDKTQGRVYKIDGDLYYSPNCSRDGVKEPTFHNDPHMLRDPKVSKVNEFLRPAYWCSPLTTFLAFIPLHLQIYQPPLQVLSCDLPIYRSSKGFWIDAQQVLSLTTLEFKLLKMIGEIKGYFNVPEHNEIIASAITLGTTFDTRKDALKVLENTRGWFALWVGLLAYNIAIATLSTNDKLNNPRPPSWWKYLNKTCNHSQAILSDIRTSDLGGFNTSNRVGTFLWILDPPEDQPSVEFFKYFNVPVFYPWGAKEAAKALSDPDLRRLAPTPEQLQSVAGFLVVQPSSKDTDIMAPWKLHYKLCQEKRDERIRTENAKQKSTCLNREKNPKLSKIPIYKWKIVNGVLICAPLDDDTVEGFGVNQRFYNSIDNEWDCSTLFGSLNPGEEEAMEEAGIMMAELLAESDSGAMHRNLAAGLMHLDAQMEPPPVDPTVPAGDAVHHPPPNTTAVALVNTETPAATRATPHHHPPTVPSQLMTSSPTPLHMAGQSRPTNSGTYVRDAFGQLQLEEYEIVDLLMKHFGFRVPFHFPAGIAPPTDEMKDRFTASDLGCSWDDDFFKSPVATLTLEFWDTVSNERPPNPAYWDLSTANNDLRHSARFQHFVPITVPLPFHEEKAIVPPPPLPSEKRLLKKKPVALGPSLAAPLVESETMYVLDFGSFNTTPWRLAVFGAVDMHMVCRLPTNFTERDLLQDLLRQGVRCQTLLPRSGIPPQMPPPLASIPLCMPGHRFTQVDYKSYCAHTCALLQNLRIARGALLAGGILWRIALLFSASLATVTNGQTWQDQSFAYPSNSANQGYSYDGSHSHLELVSWFPLPATWSSRNKQGFWTQQHESFFDQCLEEWKNLDQNIPLTATRWCDRIKLHASARRAYQFLTSASNQFR